MASRTQQQPYILLGNLADLPNPASVPQGYIFHAVDNGAAFILHILESTGVRQWDPLQSAVGTPYVDTAPLLGATNVQNAIDILKTRSVTAVTTVGAPGADTTYLGGTLVPPTQKGINFTATKTEATVYEITATGLIVTLASADPTGQRYEFYDNTGSGAPNTTFAPNAGTITSPTGINQPTAVVNVQGYWRSVTKMSNGNWLLSGL